MDTPSLLIYASANRDEWFLVRGASGKPLVQHVPNVHSGGQTNQMELDVFLAKDKGSPQRENLLNLIGTLVPEPIYSVEGSELAS